MRERKHIPEEKLSKKMREIQRGEDGEIARVWGGGELDRRKGEKKCVCKPLALIFKEEENRETI